jgi:hypothetical protein
VELELSTCAFNAGQSGDGYQFPTLEIQNIAGENIREKVFFILYLFSG